MADRKHRARPGDCFCTIAENHGHFWQTLWDLPGNAALRDERRNPNLLVEGDVVIVPELRPKTVTLATGASHRFKRHGVPSFVRVRCELFGAPSANQPFVAEAHGTRFAGTTDGDGVAVVPVAPDVRELRLVIGAGDAQQTLVLDVGGIGPIDTDGGVRARLANLGFAHDRLGDAVAAFRRAMQPDGELPDGDLIDDRLRTALVARHGC
jgi:hypothetical protein